METGFDLSSSGKISADESEHIKITMASLAMSAVSNVDFHKNPDTFTIPDRFLQVR